MHFEICAEGPSQIAEFYGRIFGWRVERIRGVDSWRIFAHANENGPLRGGAPYWPISGLSGSIVRTTGSRSL